MAFERNLFMDGQRYKDDYEHKEEKSSSSNLSSFFASPAVTTPETPDDELERQRRLDHTKYPPENPLALGVGMAFHK